MEEKNYIQEIINQIMAATDLKALPDTEEAAFRERLETQIIRRLGLLLLENLDDAGIKAYEMLLKNGEPDPEQFGEFLKKYVPDYKERVSNGMEILIKEIQIAAA